MNGPTRPGCPGVALRIRDIEQQFKCVNAAYASSPHNELSLQELRVIEYLGDYGPQMMRELAEYMLLAVNSLTTMVDNLERKNFVRRQRSEEDRRVVHVELTDTGREAYTAMVEEQVPASAGPCCPASTRTSRRSSSSCCGRSPATRSLVPTAAPACEPFAARQGLFFLSIVSSFELFV